MTTAANTEVVVAYESLGMSPEQIAENFGYECTAVKAILLAYSKEYKKAQALHVKEGNVQQEDITDDDFEIINRAYIHLALNSENDTVKEKALRTLRDEKRGRLPSQIPASSNALKAVQVNILSLNDSIKARAQQLRAKALGLNGSGAGVDTHEGNGTIINLEPASNTKRPEAPNEHEHEHELSSQELADCSIAI